MNKFQLVCLVTLTSLLLAACGGATTLTAPIAVPKRETRTPVPTVNLAPTQTSATIAAPVTEPTPEEPRFMTIADLPATCQGEQGDNFVKVTVTKLPTVGWEGFNPYTYSLSVKLVGFSDQQYDVHSEWWRQLEPIYEHYGDFTIFPAGDSISFACSGEPAWNGVLSVDPQTHPVMEVQLILEHGWIVTSRWVKQHDSAWVLVPAREYVVGRKVMDCNNMTTFVEFSEDGMVASAVLTDAGYDLLAGAGHITRTSKGLGFWCHDIDWNNHVVIGDTMLFEFSAQAGEVIRVINTGYDDSGWVVSQEFFLTEDGFIWVEPSR